MVELLLLAALVMAVVAGMRYGKPVVLDAPLIIHQAGRYHITLAPQLHQARTFIENIAGQFADSQSQAGDTPTLYFEVHFCDAPEQKNICLLAVALRDGVLYFQGINPQPSSPRGDSRLKNLREFSEAVLLHHPFAKPVDMQTVEELWRTVEDVAQQSKISVHVLQ